MIHSMHWRYTEQLLLAISLDLESLCRCTVYHWKAVYYSVSLFYYTSYSTRLSTAYTTEFWMIHSTHWRYVEQLLLAISFDIESLYRCTVYHWKAVYHSGSLIYYTSYNTCLSTAFTTECWMIYSMYWRYMEQPLLAISLDLECLYWCTVYVTLDWASAWLRWGGYPLVTWGGCAASVWRREIGRSLPLSRANTQCYYNDQPTIQGRSRLRLLEVPLETTKGTVANKPRELS